MRCKDENYVSACLQTLNQIKHGLVKVIFNTLLHGACNRRHLRSLKRLNRLVRIYLDLKTYRPNENGALIHEKIIAAGLLIDNTPYNKISLRTNIFPILYTEWNGYNEHKIISLVERQISKAQNKYRSTVVYGYNILRYGIPLLIYKSKKYSSNDPSIQGRLWWNPLSIDLQQQVLILNNNMFKGTTLENVVQAAKQLNLRPPNYHDPGYSIRELYLAKQYEEIEIHLLQDLRIVRWLDLLGLRELNKQVVREGKPLFRYIKN